MYERATGLEQYAGVSCFLCVFADGKRYGKLDSFSALLGPNLLPYFNFSYAMSRLNEVNRADTISNKCGRNTELTSAKNISNY